MESNREQFNTEQGSRVSRRTVQAGGATLVGTALAGSASSPKLKPEAGSGSPDKWIKEVVLPAAESNNPVDLSIAESRFWNEQMMEHAQFFIMLMPGPDLAGQRSEAESYERSFADLLARSSAASLDDSNYVEFNRINIEMLKPYAEWQRKLSEEQASGQLVSLVWSTFFDHTAAEADRLAARLDQFSRGDTSTDSGEAVAFWTQIMGEHADFIAHLLDPAERDLILKAMSTGDAFHKAHDNPSSATDPVERMVDEIIDFKAAAERGIIAGKIKSIIHPSLAYHVRREALKAADDLRRAA